MITAKVSNQEINKLSRRLVFAGKKIKTEVAKDLAEGALNVRNEALLKAPVDEGTLRAGIYFEKKRSNGLLWRVGVSVKYGPYVEFGTGKLVNLKWLIKAGFPSSFASQFKGKGIRKVNLQPRPFLYPSYISEIPKLKASIKRTLVKNGRSF